VPLVDVTYDHTVDDEVLRQLTEMLPEVVSEAVDCPEEPWVGPLGPGDVEIRFREKSPHDSGELDMVIEVRTKLFTSRVKDKQRRADLIRDRLAPLNVERLGVWLILAEGAWSQADDPDSPYRPTAFGRDPAPRIARTLMFQVPVHRP
jgi:hypothetical protein